MPILSFKIRDRVITHSNDNPYYVCGNSDYIVKLDMDDEWDYSIFTAVVKWKDSLMNYHAVPIPFCGDSFVLPIVNDANFIEIGLFAGNKRTTTPGIIACRSSITSGDQDIDPPSEDVYARIMELLDSVIASSKSPFIGANKHWYEYDRNTGYFVDTGIVAEGGGHKGLTRAQAAALVICFKNVKDVFSHVAWKDAAGPIVLPIFANSVDILEELLSDAEDQSVYKDGDILHINGDVNAEKNNTILEVTSK